MMQDTRPTMRSKNGNECGSKLWVQKGVASDDDEDEARRGGGREGAGQEKQAVPGRESYPDAMKRETDG